MSEQNFRETIVEPKGREITYIRLLDAPRERVWKAWTDPDIVGLWYGPDGFTITTREMNVVVGGVWRFVMHGPDGTDYPNKITYNEIVKPERMVCTHTGENDDEPGQFVHTITFEDRDGKTRLTMKGTFRNNEERDFAIEKYFAVEGGSQTLDHLEEQLVKMQSGSE